MSTLKNIAAKGSVQAILGLMSFSVASALAWKGDIDGPTYFGLTMLVAGFYFGTRNKAE